MPKPQTKKAAPRKPKAVTSAPPPVAAAPEPRREDLPATGAKLPYELVRGRKTMLRHSLREETAWKRCAARKPLATFVRDIVNDFVKTCGGSAG